MSPASPARHAIAAAIESAAGWFHVRELERGVWLLAEPPHVNTWLVVGSDRAALIDTGLGVAAIRPVVEAITPLPIMVTNTHSHFDHIGGNHEFDEIAIHEDGAALIAGDVPADLLRGYLSYVDDLERALPTYLEADGRFFFGLTEADRPRPFPASARTGGWRIQPSRATATLSDGDRIDLGGRALTVVATPGHSPDHVSFVLEREGALFAGDAVSTGAIYAQWPESEVSVFCNSAMSLANLANELRVVYVHHFQRHSASTEILREVADGLQTLRDGDATFRPNRDCAGQAVREAVFADFSIFVRSKEEHEEQ